MAQLSIIFLDVQPQIIEAGILLLVILIQVITSVEILVGISRYKNLFSDASLVVVFEEEIDTVKTNDATSELDQYKAPVHAESQDMNDAPSISDAESPKIVQLFVDTKYLGFQRVVADTNTYLKYNREAEADFHILKDVADRHGDLQEDAVQQLLPLPTYLGLIGTMLTVVIGLFFTDWSDETVSIASISPIFEGIKFALIVSAVGIALTGMLTYIFKRVHSKHNSEKNRYLSLLQEELLPFMVKAGKGELHLLNSRIKELGSTLDPILSRLAGLAGTMQTVGASQQGILEALSEVDLVKLADENVEIYRKIRKIKGDFDFLGDFASNFRETTTVAQQTLTIASGTLTKMGSVEGLASAGKQMITDYVKFRDYLELNKSLLEDQVDITKRAVGNSQVEISRAFEALENQAKASTASFKEVVKAAEPKFEEAYAKTLARLEAATDQMAHKIKESFDSQQTYFKQLEHLSALGPVLTQLQASTKQNDERYEKMATNLNRAMSQLQQASQNNVWATGENGTDDIDNTSPKVSFWKKADTVFNGIIAFVLFASVASLIIYRFFFL